MGDELTADEVLAITGKRKPSAQAAENVSGLHVETNLVVLTAKENLSKGNRFEEDKC